MTDPNIADLRALYEKATPGEWEYRNFGIGPREDGKQTLLAMVYSPTTLVAQCAEYQPTSRADADLIAAMHNALPWLLNRAERAEQAEREMPPEQVEQMATWERELTDYAHRSDSSGRAARLGLEVLGTLRRSRMASMVTVIAYRKSIEKRLELERERDALRSQYERARATMRHWEGDEHEALGAAHPRER